MGSYELHSDHGIGPKIKLYTNHGCPWAHRAHITLKELGLPYEEVIIDLTKPREPWYLEINPRGLVPSIQYSNGVVDEIITESGIVAQFLADMRPSHLLPPSLSTPESPLVRARISFFVDAWFSKCSTFTYPMYLKNTLEEKEEESKKMVAAIEKEIEPLLKNANPFFNGSSQMTMAEVLVAPFIIRLYASCDDELLPKSLAASLDKLPNFSRWAKTTISQESVTYVFDEEKIIKGTKERIAKMKKEKEQAK